MKYFLSIAAILFMNSTVFAYEDCIISTKGKLTDISIEHNDKIDVFPLTTIMNEKNTLILHPLKSGSTRFCVLKDGKDKIMFNVKVETDKTTVEPVEGFDILTVDCPPDLYEYELDEPPLWMNY